jgi:hypothetical protein
MWGCTFSELNAPYLITNSLALITIYVFSKGEARILQKGGLKPW